MTVTSRTTPPWQAPSGHSGACPSASPIRTQERDVAARLAGPPLEDVRARQADVLTVDQALLWWERTTVYQRVRRGQWQAPHRGVVVLHNGPLTASQMRWAALLAAPPGSALWGATAAALDGFRDLACHDDEQVHVVMPPGSRRLALPFASSHWSSRLDDEDVHPLAGPRRTRLPRSLLDMAAGATDPRRAAGVLYAGTQQRLVTPEALRLALERRGPCRHRELILETVDDVEGGIQSVPERDFARIVTRSGLPAPTRQAVLRRPDGRFYLDVLWESHLLTVEVDGAHHRSAAAWDADLERSAVIVAGGLRQMRFSSYAVRHRPERVAQLLAIALGCTA